MSKLTTKMKTIAAKSNPLKPWNDYNFHKGLSKHHKESMSWYSKGSYPHTQHAEAYQHHENLANKIRSKYTDDGWNKLRGK